MCLMCMWCGRKVGSMEWMEGMEVAKSTRAAAGDWRAIHRYFSGRGNRSENYLSTEY